MPKKKTNEPITQPINQVEALPPDATSLKQPQKQTQKQIFGKPVTVREENGRFVLTDTAGTVYNLSKEDFDLL